MTSNADPNTTTMDPTPVVEIYVLDIGNVVRVKWGDGAANEIVQPAVANYDQTFHVVDSTGGEPYLKKYGSLLSCDGGILTLGEKQYRIQVQRQQNQQQQPPGLLADCVAYEYSQGNGVDPRSFTNRPVADSILSILPLSFENDAMNDPAKKIRVLLHGSPGSGKTSILGHVFQSLKDRYPGVPVFYIRASKYKNKAAQITAELRGIQKFVVILDDAHDWYEEKGFFAQFKGSPRILVAAATYAVTSVNYSSPVDIQAKYSAELEKGEEDAIFTRMGIPSEHRNDLLNWFGNSFGRIQLLVPSLNKLWSQAKLMEPQLTLQQFYFRASTLQALEPHRFVPAIDPEMKKLLMQFLRGQAGDTVKEKLSCYGVLGKDGDWSCDFVCRWYFSSLFQRNEAENWAAFGNHSLPSSAQLVTKGLSSLEWPSVQECRESSNSGFPIENVWQATFYAAIGQYIPQNVSFCKERVTGTDNRVDFVLRNSSTRGIEFLIRSSNVDRHHERFEPGGAYTSLGLAEYLVVDIVPWNSEPDINAVSHDRLLARAKGCFDKLTLARRGVHGVFVVSNDVQRGILYLHNGKDVYEAVRSPPAW